MDAHLRYRNPDGSTKDWVIEKIPGGFRIRWGKTEHVNRQVQYEDRRFPAGVFPEMRKRIQAQVRQGYRYVGGVPPGCPPGDVWESESGQLAPPPAAGAPTAPSAPAEQPQRRNPDGMPVWDLSEIQFPLFI